MRAAQPASVGLVCLCVCGTIAAQHPHDVVWDSPSENAFGSMPLGNGDIGLNAWVDATGDLIFYISKTDAWSDNGRLLKVGRLRLSMEPPMVMEAFEQRLSLLDGALVARAGEGAGATTVRLWVDANNPMIQIDVACATPRRATVTIELWRTERQRYPEAEVSDLLEDRSKPNRLHTDVYVEQDTVIADLPDAIGWYHHNTKSVGPELIARLQGLTGYFEGKVDPLLHRTFGAIVTAEGGERLDDRQLRSPTDTSHHFQILVLTDHPTSPKAWIESAWTQLAAIRSVPLADRRARHQQWWRAFWDRSWIHVTSGAPPGMIPVNAHPLRIGVDQHDGNRFTGEIGRLAITPRVLEDEVIAVLASEGSSDGRLGEAYRRDAPARGAIDGSAGWRFDDGLTIEAWIRPGEMPSGGGRIVDKITPGGADGLLFDTHPHRSLRLIVGRHTLLRNDVLPADAWSHVAAVIDPVSRRLAMFLNGSEIVSETVELLDDATVVSQAYALQRYVDACAGRGAHPIKFNGSIFTVPFEGKFGDADYRRWGPGYWWQNTRLPYLSMCASGDFDTLRPLFRMYADELMPLHVYRTKAYTGHDGAFIPECVYFWGPTFTATYGWTPYAERSEDKLQESRWHKWEWVSGPELIWMMLDYYEHTLDEAFLGATLLPAARPLLQFFNEHYSVDEEGRLIMHPSQSAETWWECTNPMPEVAGLRAVTERLLRLPHDRTTSEDRLFWEALRQKLPELPTRTVDGVTMLAPAERFADKRNVENPELYAVFPFRLVSFEKPNAELGLAALEHRADRGHFGWRQDDLFMTHLGLTNQARAGLVTRARNKHAQSRFPVFWGPNYDWVPDQDHGGVLMRTLQTMLMQTEGRTIHLLPAWPAEWDVDFKLHAPLRTTISGRWADGELLDLTVDPPARLADVVVHEPKTR